MCATSSASRLFPSSLGLPELVEAAPHVVHLLGEGGEVHAHGAHVVRRGREGLAAPGARQHEPLGAADVEVGHQHAPGNHREAEVQPGAIPLAALGSARGLAISPNSDRSFTGFSLTDCQCPSGSEMQTSEQDAQVHSVGSVQICFFGLRAVFERADEEPIINDFTCRNWV